MARIRITFNRCIQDSQEYGSDDEHMVSRVFFNIQVNGEGKGEFTSDIKQTVGGGY